LETLGVHLKLYVKRLVVKLFQGNLDVIIGSVWDLETTIEQKSVFKIFDAKNFAL